MKPLSLKNDANGNNSFALPFSDSIMSRSLGVATAEAVTVPTGANYAVFSYTTDVYVLADGTAAVPADVTDGTASELNPTIRDCSDVTSISCISPAACVITVAFYS